MILWLSTFAFSIASALIPFLPIEVYIVGAGASNGGEALSLGLAAGLGATIGKVVWYELGRRSFDSSWVQKKLAKPKTRQVYDRWVARMDGRPWFAGGIMFVASSVGIPPLLVMAVVAGALRMPMWIFLPTVLVGRTLRFTLIFLGVDLALH